MSTISKTELTKEEHKRQTKDLVQRAESYLVVVFVDGACQAAVCGNSKDIVNMANAVLTLVNEEAKKETH